MFIGIEHRLERGTDAEIRAMLRLAERMDVHAVATDPVRYLLPDDAFVADALECMRRIVPLADTNVSRTNAEGWLKPAVDLRALFAERPDLCDATVDIAERCTFDLGLGASTSQTSRRPKAAAPTPCSPSDAGAACTSAACPRPSPCANGCTTSSR